MRSNEQKLLLFYVWSVENKTRKNYQAQNKRGKRHDLDIIIAKHELIRVLRYRIPEEIDILGKHMKESEKLTCTAIIMKISFRFFDMYGRKSLFVYVRPNSHMLLHTLKSVIGAIVSFQVCTS